MTTDDTTRSSSAEREPLYQMFRKVFALVDETVEGVTDDEVDARLHQLLETTGSSRAMDAGTVTRAPTDARPPALGGGSSRASSRRHTGGGLSLVERFVVGVDMQRFSSRVTRRQVTLQRDLDRMLDDAADAAGVRRELWERQSAGDGEVAVLPADVDLLAVVRFVSELDQRLADHNEDHSPATGIRLRVAMHIDVITRGALGYAGPALVVLRRLLDSAPARAALTDNPEANLALIISESLYQKAVLPEFGRLWPGQFERVQVGLLAKASHQTANVYVSVPVSTPAPTPAPSADPPPNQPERPAQPSGVPFPISPTRPVPRRKPPRHVSDDPPEQSPSPVPEPAFEPAVRELVRKARESLEDHEAVLAKTTGRHREPPLGRLSVREVQVLELVSGSLTNREIAERLHLSPATVQRHLANIYTKLNARKRTEVARRGLELGLWPRDR